MTRQTPAEKETAAHRCDLLLCNRAGDIVESHRMQDWDLWKRAGELAGAFRDAHGYSPNVRARYLDRRPVSAALLPKDWR